MRPRRPRTTRSRWTYRVMDTLTNHRACCRCRERRHGGQNARITQGLSRGFFPIRPTDSWAAVRYFLSPPTRRGKLAPIGTTDRAEPRPFALTNRLTVLSSPPMNETGWRLRLHRQDRDRPHRARQAPHPDPGCQPQDHLRRGPPLHRHRRLLLPRRLRAGRRRLLAWQPDQHHPLLPHPGLQPCFQGLDQRSLP